MHSEGNHITKLSNFLWSKLILFYDKNDFTFIYFINIDFFFLKKENVYVTSGDYYGFLGVWSYLITGVDIITLTWHHKSKLNFMPFDCKICGQSHWFCIKFWLWNIFICCLIMNLWVGEIVQWIGFLDQLEFKPRVSPEVKSQGDREWCACPPIKLNYVFSQLIVLSGLEIIGLCDQT